MANLANGAAVGEGWKTLGFGVKALGIREFKVCELWVWGLGAQGLGLDAEASMWELRNIECPPRSYLLIT